ncbi:MAG: hypothetical protein IKM34_07930, partial [Clostridia bacterium]|nr:hypothetical protein [Clostridia bacterium]
MSTQTEVQNPAEILQGTSSDVPLFVLAHKPILNLVFALQIPRFANGEQTNIVNEDANRGSESCRNFARNVIRRSSFCSRTQTVFLKSYRVRLIFVVV